MIIWQPVGEKNLQLQVSATLLMLDSHRDSSCIFCCCPVWWRSCSFGSAACDPSRAPAEHRWGGCWGGLTHNPGSWPGELQSWSDPHHHQGELSSTTLASLSCAAMSKLLSLPQGRLTHIYIRDFKDRNWWEIGENKKMIKYFLTVHSSSYCMSLWVPTEKHSPEGPPQCWFYMKNSFTLCLKV